MVFKNNKKTQLKLERLAAKEEREQQQLIENIKDKKEKIEEKADSAYHFRIVSKDLVGNVAYSDDISLITPPKEKSLLQVIIKSLEDTFSWVGRLRERWSR